MPEIRHGAAWRVREPLGSAPVRLASVRARQRLASATVYRPRPVLRLAFACLSHRPRAARLRALHTIQSALRLDIVHFGRNLRERAAGRAIGANTLARNAGRRRGPDRLTLGRRQARDGLV